MDLKKGYYQIELDKKYIDKTAFCIPGGNTSLLRVEFHSNSGPPTQKNSGLLTQKLLAASNGELYTAM